MCYYGAKIALMSISESARLRFQIWAQGLQIRTVWVTFISKSAANYSCSRPKSIVAPCTRSTRMVSLACCFDHNWYDSIPSVTHISSTSKKSSFPKTLRNFFLKGTIYTSCEVAHLGSIILHHSCSIVIFSGSKNMNRSSNSKVFVTERISNKSMSVTQALAASKSLRNWGDFYCKSCLSNIDKDVHQFGCTLNLHELYGHSHYLITYSARYWLKMIVLFFTSFSSHVICIGFYSIYSALFRWLSLILAVFLKIMAHSMRTYNTLWTPVDNKDLSIFQELQKTKKYSICNTSY